MDDTEKPEVRRNADGTWPSGQSGNAAGQKRMTWQAYANRVAYFREMTREEIERIYNAPDFKKRPDRDCAIIKQIIVDAHETLLDREIGKPLSRGEMTGADGQPLFGNDPRATIESKLLSPVAGSGESPKTEKSE